MKKVILILFLFFLCYACYYIYKHTEKKEYYIVSIGDELAYNPYILDNYNYDYTNKDYHMLDLLNIIKYNQEKEINNHLISIHQLLKKADILIISIGINDIYYKLNDNTFEVYSYLNNLIANYDELLSLVAKYDYHEVYILNYYMTNSKYNDLFTYVNYKLNKLANKYHYTYLDIAKILNNRKEFYLKNNDYSLNNKGYCQIFNLIVEKLKKS